MKNVLAVFAVFAVTTAFAVGKSWWVAKNDPNAADTPVEGCGTEALPF